MNTTFHLIEFHTSTVLEGIAQLAQSFNKTQQQILLGERKRLNVRLGFSEMSILFFNLVFSHLHECTS